MSIGEFIYTTLLKPKPLRKLANAAILRILPETVAVGPATVRLNPNDPVVSGALATRQFERAEIAFFLDACRPGMTVVDVGANVGLYTAIAMHRAGPSGRVVAIEPHEESRVYLAQTIAANTPAAGAPVEIVACAVADREGHAELYSNEANKGDNRIYASDLTPATSATAIRTARLDTILAERGISGIDLLKMDIQGAELLALEGARETVAASPGMMLLSEFWPQGLNHNRPDGAMRYLTLLSALNFDIRLLGSGERIASDDFAALIARLPGRKYANLACVRSA